MTSSSIFEFSGFIERAQITVRIYKIGLAALDFEKFNQSDDKNAISSEKPEKVKKDEIVFKWNEKVGSPTTSQKSLFSLRDDDEFPEYLEKFRKSSMKNLNNPKKTKREHSETLLFYGEGSNENVIYRVSEPKHMEVERSSMYIFAHLGGNSDTLDERSVYQIVRIEVNNQNQMRIEPAIDPKEGIKIETPIGDFVVEMDFEDSGVDEEDEFPRRGSRPSVTSLPEAESFSVARDGFIESVLILTIQNGFDFLFDEGMIIDYELLIPSKMNLKSGNQRGKTQKFGSNSEKIYNFQHILEFVLEYVEIEEMPRILFRFYSVDFWGRQYVAGYANAVLSLIPGRDNMKINCWRPTEENALREFFIGQSVDVNYFELMKKSPNKRILGSGQSSGNVTLESYCISQSRKYMARDVLYQLKYGSKMADMGLRSDFYQRIIKVLMEFEEARAKLLTARAIGKKKKEALELKDE